ncbi:2660_t:CDS:2, partial [Dentiscutata heterogama]
QQPAVPQNVSSACQQEIIKLSSSSDLANCASFVKLYPLQNATIQNATSIYDSYCAAPKCSDSITSADAAELKNQCQSELAMKDPTTSYLKTILVFNSPVRDSLCFKNSSGGYCDLDDNSAAVFNYLLGLSYTQPTNLSCSDCNKAILNTFANFFKSNPQSVADLSIDPTSFESFVTSKCGSSFLDGTVPNTSSPPKKSSGISIHSLSFIGFTMFAASFISLIVYVI